MPTESKKNRLSHLKHQLERWEKEGYDIYELKTKWHKELYDRELKRFSGKTKLGLGSLIVSLIFGIITIIFFFLPWFHSWYGPPPSWSGWDVITQFSNHLPYNLYYLAYLVLIFSSIIVISTLFAIVNYKKQGIHQLFSMIALLAAIVALGASMFSEYAAVNLNDYFPYISAYGPIAAIVCCSIGLLSLLIANLAIWRHRYNIRRLVE